MSNFLSTVTHCLSQHYCFLDYFWNLRLFHLQRFNFRDSTLQIAATLYISANAAFVNFSLKYECQLLKSNVASERDDFIKKATFVQTAWKKLNEVGEILLISNMKGTALMHSAHVSIIFSPHLRAHLDIHLSPGA